MWAMYHRYNDRGKLKPNDAEIGPKETTSFRSFLPRIKGFKGLVREHKGP